MTPAGALFGALLLLAAEPLPSGDAAPTAMTHFRFAPPVDRPMTYRVTTRRIDRDGALINFALVYALQWERLGRGFRLQAVLQRIDSDARPEVTRALTLMLEPLVGQEISYLVAPGGSRVDLVDPDGLWERVTARIEAAGAAGGRSEARQLAQIVAALPEAERDRLATADIRALIAPANEAIPTAAEGAGASVSMRHDGSRQTFAKVEREPAAAGAAGSLEIDNLWTVDAATGLVVSEHRQSWIVEPDGNGRRLVEERVRALEPAP
ncbi:hypothetical protein [Sphingopyxis sp. JAI128]|uniref:hypothetical protein n=1 Tax=Sphingopyxis sp. JAI128 TaxID=2723066 RepID=UPI0016152160|nr:hypothetical protein [Sphingopyxis sp. JAI128]MBB6427570.1 hypothetical protein [Sphingopyxis sp. JAI128]